MDEELLAEFLTESNESLASIEQQLMDLEASPDDEELLGSIFRAVHTVKGSCGFLGLKGLEKVAHAGENLLGRIRALKFHVNDEIVSLLLECTDAIKGYIEGLEETGSEPELDYADLIERLHVAESHLGQTDEHSTESSADEDMQAWASDLSEDVLQALASQGIKSAQDVMNAGFATLQAIDGIAPADALKTLGIAKSAVANGEKPQAKKAKAETSTAKSETKAKKEDKKEQKEAAIATEKAAAPTAPAAKKTRASKPKGAASVRVDVDLLDSLMNQVGELVLTRNRLVQMVAASGNMEFVRVSRDVDQITEQLQIKLLQTRMQPIQSVWSSVPRIVRDMGKQLDKKIAVVMEGEETELDRTILNALKDPLTHIIRNSCDHGIEMPSERREAGKPAEGTLRLSASQESGSIIIQIEDDGAGIDAEKVKTKAVSMNVLTQEQADKISNQAALQLIFHAGLSTAQKVSNLSGRGVGMDVVRTEIEKVGGNVDISSEPGKGTTLRIRIPLTLAIISAMIVGCGRHQFAIPQMSVQELLNAPKDSEDWRMIGGKPFYRLRGKLLPIMRLNEVLKLSETVENQGNIIVIDIGDRVFGVLVDDIYGAEEIVVKPLGAHFQHMGFYGGCSILGDGKVIPIFDCNELANLMQLSQDAKLVQEEEDEADGLGQEMQYTLVFEQAQQRFAIPMALIERLECFPEEKIEKSGASEVLQYRGDVIPVLRWGELTSLGNQAPSDEPVYGLILSDSNRSLCLQVEEVVDILETPLDIKMASSSPLFLGTAVIEDIATEVVDVFEVVKQIDPDWFTRKHKVAVSDSETDLRPKILFVEDAVFFRNLVIPVLDSLDYETWTAVDGIEACKILEERTPDLILTDLEMPNMNGYELAEWVRARPELDDIPVVALTATAIDDIAMEQRKKFQDVMMKLNRQSLAEGLGAILGKKVKTVASEADSKAQTLSV